MTRSSRSALMPPAILFYAGFSKRFVPPDLATRPLGGSETALRHIAWQLARRGHRVAVVGNPGGRAGFYDGVEYLDRSSPAWRQRRDIDIAVVFRYFPDLLRTLPGQLRLLWVHDHIGISPEKPSGLRPWVTRRIWPLGYRMLADRVHRIVAVSDWLRDCIVRFAGWPAAHVSVIPNGVDARLFTPASGPLSPPPPQPRPFRVAYTSVPERGLLLLVQRIMPALWRRLPHTELHVFSYRSFGWRRWTAAGERRIRWPGGLTQPELARALPAFDLWLYPTDFPETSCIAAMEAQAAGVPVVASRRYALPETVEDGGSGVLIDGPVGSPDYVERFAATTAALLQDPERRARLGRRGQERILGERTWHTLGGRWSDLVQDLWRASGS